ncbi:MAG TPA: cation-transporting P-type ATPase [Spirochaetota bacterium]|nr:cation-transporting P-type ATPase [Spirochaetota bacterium]
METIIGKHWHHIDPAEAAGLLGTDTVRGLDVHEHKRRLEHFGPNVLTPKKGKGPLVRFLLQFHQPLVYILIAAGIVTGVLGEWVDSSVIFGVVLVNAIIGFLQEAKAVSAIEALAGTVRTEATVLRAGVRERVDASDVVPGDIVFLQSGDKVPADMRLFSVKEFRADESALTGESLPVDKIAEALPKDTTLADRRNMAFASSLVTYGQAEGIVTATGDRTEVGAISGLIAAAPDLQTPLTKKMARFSRLLLFLILVLAGATFAVGVWRGEPAIDMFMSAVALAVGAIPEGLPAALTISLAIGVSRMARRRAVIRRLPAVETLGSTTVICSDKTGTLTQNQMTVQALYAGGARYEVTGIGYVPEGSILRGGSAADVDREQALRECLVAGLLCNDSDLRNTEGSWTVHGDPTEIALITAAVKGGVDTGALKKSMPRKDVIPFESQNQFMATLHEAGGGPQIYVKGAIEVVLGFCGTAMASDGSGTSLDAGAVTAEAELMAGQGLRVIAFAGKKLNGGEGLARDALAGMTLLGLQGMIDPPRPEALAAVKACQRAGIAVKMITGDHLSTARSIAGRLGILAGDTNPAAPAGAMAGAEIEALSDEALSGRIEDIAVFARVTPEQKLRLVDALQDRGHVVAMTGDGVNDAPALKTADIGIAMGVAGTEVAREAADMLLTDDNFATIEAAVEEGRGVFDNITKFIVWTIPTNLGEGLVILAAIFAGVAMPVLPVQILWINMTTAVLLGLMLAFEPKEPGLMTRPPRDPASPIITGALIFRIMLVGALLLAGAFGLFELEMSATGNLAVARTAAVNVFVMGELLYLFNCRSLTESIFRVGFFSNPLLFAGVAAMALLQLGFTYVPAMNTLFNSAPITLARWGYIMVCAFAIYALVGMEKMIGGLLRRRGNKKAG